MLVAQAAIDSVVNKLAVFEASDIGGHLPDRDMLMGWRRNMRRQPDFGVCPERAFGWQRLDAEDVERCTAELATIERSDQVGIDNVASASSIYEEGANFNRIDQFFCRRFLTFPA